MPNHVTNKITFSTDKDFKRAIALLLNDDGRVDFELLIPPPQCMYYGNLSSDDEKDFPVNWLSWSRANWGTKWNACNPMEINQIDRFIQFDTARSPPYPILAGLVNHKLAFTFKAFDEGWNFASVENYGPVLDYTRDSAVPVWTRARKRPLSRKDADPAEWKALCLELKGYDPDDRGD